MAEPNEETGLLLDENSTLLEATPIFSHERKDSLLPEFIFTSIDNMAEVVNEITEHIEDMAHEATTFEPLDVDALVAEHEAEREADADAETLSPEEEEEKIEELINPTDPMDPFGEREKLGVIPLAVMVFYSVSGGPFGCETSVRAGGYFYALLGFLVMPCIWSVQEALMTAELGTTFPEASGGVAWVEEAFGQNAGWMSGYLGWIAGATDNAIYPVLFMDYLLQALHSDGENFNPILRFCLLASTSIALGYVNWLGLPLVGKMSVSICLVAMSPFIILILFGSWKINPSRWFELPQEDLTYLETLTDDDTTGGFFPNAALGGVLWRPFLNNLFWNLNSFDAAGSFAAELDDPARVLPKALLYSVVMVVACYFLPLAVAIGASESEQHEWVDGYLARVTGDVIGPWLGAWTVFAAGISNIALFQAELSADAFQLMGMADRGHLPKLFSHRSRHGTPTYGVVLGTAVIVVMGVSNLDALIELLNFNYAISLLMEYSAFIKLRISRPDLERPWRIPLNTFGCILLFTPTFLLTFLVLGLATYSTFIFAICVNVVGMLVFKAKERSERIREAEEEAEKAEGSIATTTILTNDSAR